MSSINKSKSEKADKLVNGDGKLEEIIVCSNEIAASTAQLVVASNVKADRESKNRIALVEAKKNVSNATAGLVASAKSCSQIIDDQSNFLNFYFNFFLILFKNNKSINVFY